LRTGSGAGPRRQRRKRRTPQSESNSLAQRKLTDGKMSLQELEQYLWRAADILRGPIEVSEYKNYILTLLFYKRLSDVYLEEYQQLLAEYGDETSGRSEPTLAQHSTPPLKRSRRPTPSWRAS